MKIRNLTPENHGKVAALLRQSFPGSSYEVRLFENLHENERTAHEWVCIHTNKIIAYIAFTNGYCGKEIYGLHLAPLAVAPHFQQQGVGTELLRFAMRQNLIKEKTIFVLGNPDFYGKFGFEPCTLPRCPFTKNNKNFLHSRNTTHENFTIGYEPEFMIGV